MCGITGIFDWTTLQAARHIQAMTDTLRHRGPDGEGYACFHIGDDAIFLGRGADTPPEFRSLPAIQSLSERSCQVALGHRRLSILDLSASGHNPMPNADDRFWITYNGEVYNYLELRAELSLDGYGFQSQTDTEVILAAYQKWGLDCLAHFNGMFAFAIWDRQERRLFCARDRFGIKPFYYAQRAGWFAFASEIKALLAHPDIPVHPNPQAIYDYLVNGVIADSAFFEGIRPLPAGYALTVAADGQMREWRYYDLPSINRAYHQPDLADRAAQFRDLLTDAVRLRLRSDVPIGSALSGGLDSSSLVTVANHLLQTESGIKRDVIGEQQRVFCAIYAGEPFNEHAHMQTIIAQTGAKAHFTEPTSADLWQALESLIWHQDEPVNATAIFAQYQVMALARAADVTVLLDGQGGDEVLGGYQFYYGYHIAQGMRRGAIPQAWGELMGARRHSAASWGSLLALTGWNLSPSWLRDLGWRMGGAKMLSHKPLDPSWVHPDFRRDYHTASRIKHRAYPTLSDKLYDDVFHTNLPTLLRYEDRNSMAFHIEARVPFLDHRLVEFAFAQAADAHIRGGWSKFLLREAMQDHLPDSIRWRKDKEGYTTPHQRWMQELTPQINAWFAGQPRSLAYLSDEALAHLRGPQAGNSVGVWRLINLEGWLRAFDRNR